jgi:hypothetical protein
MRGLASIHTIRLTCQDFMERSSVMLAAAAGRRRTRVRTSSWWIMGLAAFCAAGVSGAATAAPTCNNPEILHLLGLRHGDSSAVVERRDSVSTDRTACYQLNIQGGSRILTVRLFSDDAAAYLRLYAPNWTSKRVGDGWTFHGPTLPGAGAGDHATKWKGPAPLGNVLIVVDMAGTGRQYRLRVEAQ